MCDKNRKPRIHNAYHPYYDVVLKRIQMPRHINVPEDNMMIFNDKSLGVDINRYFVLLEDPTVSFDKKHEYIQKIRSINFYRDSLWEAYICKNLLFQ